MARTLGQRLSDARQREERRGVKKRGEHQVDKKIEIPADVLRSRESLLRLKPISISQILLGDPLPGRSALERGPDPKPQRRVDVLDSLIYRH